MRRGHACVHTAAPSVPAAAARTSPQHVCCLLTEPPEQRGCSSPSDPFGKRNGYQSGRTKGNQGNHRGIGFGALDLGSGSGLGAEA